MKSLELRWGLILGFAYLIWLYVSFWLGMHTKGIVAMQLVVMIQVVLSLGIYTFSLGTIFRQQPEMTWKEGVKSGLVIAGISAIMAVIAQWGYFTFVNPEYPEYMANQARQYFEQAGAPADKLEELVEAAGANFTMKNYMLQAALLMLVSGAFFSMVIMAFLRKSAR